MCSRGSCGSKIGSSLGPRNWSGEPMDRLESLRKRGWVSPSLAYFDGLELEKVKDVLGPACADWGLEDFEALRSEAKKQKLMVDAEDTVSVSQPSSAHKDISWEPQSGHRELRRTEEGVALDKVRAVLPRMIWPTPLHRKRSSCKDEGQRQKVEEEERDRQIAKLVALLRRTSLLEESMEGPVGPAGAWTIKRHALGRRANTRRVHVRLGERMREYTRSTHGAEWFRNVAEVMDYIAGR